MNFKILPQKNNCEYTQFYCEENIWKLCEYIKLHNPEILNLCFAVFISNHQKKIPLWKQKLHDENDSPVVWDYHVIFIHKAADTSWVYDLDTYMTFPCGFTDYTTQAIRGEENLRHTYHRLFRVVPADTYLATFASDRRHMTNQDGSWKQTPPPYPPIHTKDASHNIDDFISMDPSIGWGDVLTLQQFNQTFST